jgi:hypothetical protein
MIGSRRESCRQEDPMTKCTLRKKHSLGKTSGRAGTSRGNYLILILENKISMLPGLGVLNDHMTISTLRALVLSNHCHHHPPCAQEDVWVLCPLTLCRSKAGIASPFY